MPDLAMDSAENAPRISKDAAIQEIEKASAPASLDQEAWTAEEEAKLVRKIDLFLLPTIWLMYLLSYMDRTK